MQKLKLYKLIWLIILCMATYMPLCAQESTSPLTYGPKVGLGISSLALDRVSPLGQSRTIVSIGGFAQYWLKPWLGVNADLMYSQAGGSDLKSRLFYFKDSPMLGIPELNKYIERTDLLIHRLELPLTALITMPDVPGRPIFIIGPSLGWNIKSVAINTHRWEFQEAPNDLVTVTKDILGKKIQATDLAAVFGIAWDINSDPLNMMLGITYRMSMTNTNNYMYSLYPYYSFNNAQIFISAKF